MRLGLRIFLGYFLIVALAAWLVLNVFVGQVKPGVRQAMEDTLVDTANVLALLAADDLRSGHMNDGAFAKRVGALARRDVRAHIWGLRKDTLDYRVYVTDSHGIVVFDSTGKDVGHDYSRWNDVYLTLRGQYGARSTQSVPGDANSTVMHVAAPIRDGGGRIIGVLTVAKANRTLAPFIARSQLAIQRWGLLLLGVALAVGIGVSLWFSRELTRLRRYAQTVTVGARAPPPRGPGEFGELGRALDTMRERLDGKQYVEQYVQDLTHEMKSPLAAIRGAVELLHEGVPEAERRQFAANILDHSQRLARMVDMTLALAAVEHRQAIEHPEVFDAVALVCEIAGEFGTWLAAAGCVLRVDAPDAPINIAGDRFLVGQAIRNLLHNALDFSPRDGEIIVSLRSADGFALLDVRDRGPGIPDYALDKVFDRFYSLARPDGQRSSGLGLCFVREVAALHAGTIALENAAGDGAIATLRLPVV